MGLFSNILIALAWFKCLLFGDSSCGVWRKRGKRELLLSFSLVFVASLVTLWIHLLQVEQGAFDSKRRKDAKIYQIKPIRKAPQTLANWKAAEAQAPGSESLEGPKLSDMAMALITNKQRKGRLVKAPRPLTAHRPKSSGEAAPKKSQWRESVPEQEVEDVSRVLARIDKDLHKCLLDKAGANREQLDFVRDEYLWDHYADEKLYDALVMPDVPKPGLRDLEARPLPKGVFYTEDHTYIYHPVPTKVNMLTKKIRPRVVRAVPRGGNRHYSVARRRMTFKNKGQE